jgi:hypothetical protein
LLKYFAHGIPIRTFFAVATLFTCFDPDVGFSGSGLGDLDDAHVAVLVALADRHRLHEGVLLCQQVNVRVQLKTSVALYN